MRAAPALLALVALLAGCIGSGDPGLLGPALLSVGDAVRIDDQQPAREPAIVQGVNGDLYVAGFWGFGRHTEYPGTPQNIAQGPLVWKSTDGGSSWARLNPGLPAQGALSNSDLDLAAARDGTVYLTALTYYSPPTMPSDVPAPPTELPTLPVDPASTLSVVVGASQDDGATWVWRRLDQGPMRSHPWVAVHDDGLAHVVWADGAGLRHAVSDDRGASWVEGERVHDVGESGGVAVHGEAVAVRVAPLGAPEGAAADGVAVSDDRGATWRFVPRPAATGGDGAVLGFGSVAFDGAGALYLVWAQGSEVRAARSLDLGATWTTTPLVTDPRGPYFPYARGGPAGDVAVSWFLPVDDTVQAHALHATYPADGTAPRVRAAVVEDHTGGTNHADYFQLAFLEGGGLGVPVPMTTDDLGQWFDYRVVR